MISRILQILAFGTLALLTAYAKEAGTHLEPADGYLSSYPHSHAYLSAVRTILVRNAIESPAAMVTLPSFQPESVVFTEPKNDQVRIVLAFATKQIWSTPKNEDITVTQKERPIKARIADQIGAAFALATSQTRYSKENTSGLDGTTYHFSSFVVGTGLRAGETWSPDAETVCGMLVSLGEHMAGYARGEVAAEKLEQEARTILRLLDKKM